MSDCSVLFFGELHYLAALVEQDVEVHALKHMSDTTEDAYGDPEQAAFQGSGNFKAIVGDS